MFYHLISIENTKNLKRLMLWIELGLLSLFMALFIGLLYLSLHQLPPGVTVSSSGDSGAIAQLITWPIGLVNLMSFGSGTGLDKLLLVVLVGAVVAQEYSWRTLQLWISRGVPRPVFMLAKFSALLLPAFLIVLVPFLVGGTLTALTSLNINGSLHLEEISALQLVWSLFRTAYTLLPYAALTFLLAIATRSVVAAIGGALAYALLLENVLVQLLALLNPKLASIGMYLPSGLGNSLILLNQMAIRTSAPANPGASQLQLLDPTPAAIGIALWTLALLGLSMWIFQRQDLSE